MWVFHKLGARAPPSRRANDGLRRARARARSLPRDEGEEDGRADVGRRQGACHQGPRHGLCTRARQHRAGTRQPWRRVGRDLVGRSRVARWRRSWVFSAGGRHVQARHRRASQAARAARAGNLHVAGSTRTEGRCGGRSRRQGSRGRGSGAGARAGGGREGEGEGGGGGAGAGGDPSGRGQDGGGAAGGAGGSGTCSSGTCGSGTCGGEWQGAVAAQLVSSVAWAPALRQRSHGPARPTKA